MKTNTVWKSFLSEEQTLALSHTYKNEVYYHLILTIENSILAEHIKDICIQEIHPLFEELSDQHISINTIEWLVEDTLQKVNHWFSLFAEQINSNEHITINGALVISYQGNILVSLIGDSSLLICRNGKSIYNMSNTDTNKNTSINHFTDYISGSIHIGDSILILGYDHSVLFHNNELHKIAQIIDENDPEMLVELESLMTQRAEESTLWFMSLVRNISHTIDFSGIKNTQANFLKFLPKNQFGKLWAKGKDFREKNSYSLTLGLLGLFVIVSIYNIINGALTINNNNPTIQTTSGVQTVSIESIKEEINLFQSLDPKSDEKGVKYKEINEKLEFLKKQGKWLEDVTALQKIVQNKYYEWFNIIAVNKLDDIGWEFQPIYPFTSNETKILWQVHSLFYERWFYIWGTKWALIKWINKDIKGTPISYSLPNDMKKCTQDLSRSWLYCFDSKNEIYRITAWSIQSIAWNENVSLPTAIQDIGIFGKTNIYLMVDPKSNGWSDLIRRFTIQPGNFAALKDSIGYGLNNPITSSWNWPVFKNMTIDWLFLSRSSTDKQLYQFERDPVSNKLKQRIIALKGWDTTYVGYSDDVKIVSSSNSRYVYLFDRTNKTLTIYTSNPTKTTQWNQTLYNLQYVMRYAFDASLWVIDLIVPDINNTKAVLYVMTNNGIYESNIGQNISLYENK
jgi:hypothetical protein